MPNETGYFVDLLSVKLSDDELPVSWIQALPVGTYQHPTYGEIAITEERVKRFAGNVNERVRGIDLDIDYDHKEKTNEAAGWVRRADARDDGLWLLVEWTKHAAEKIKTKAYRYFSAEFHDEWTNPSGTSFKDVLFGGGITNRPYLKNILPINLSELVQEPHKQSQGGTSMDPKKLRELLGLQESATDGDVEAAIKKFKETPPSGVGGSGGTTDQKLVKLAEDNPVIKTLMETQAAQAKLLAETQAALQLSEITSTVSKLNEGKQHQLPAVVLNELPAALVQMPKTLRESVVGIITKLTETGLVNTKEVGNSGGAGGGRETDDIKAFTEAVKKAQDDNKLDYAAAVRTVSLREPQLFEAYRQASFSGREN